MHHFYTKTFWQACILVVAALLVGQITAWAQNPSYVVSSLEGSYTPLSTRTVLSLRSGAVSNDDEYFQSIDLNALSFNFTYNTRRVTSLIPTTNGTIGFGAIPYQGANTLVAYNNLMAGVRSGVEFLSPFGTDLNSSLGDVSYQVTGAAGTKVLTIQYRDFRFNAGTQRAIDFQVKLYEAGNIIEYQYANAADQNTLGVFVGLRGPLPSVASCINLASPSTDWSKPVRTFGFSPGFVFRARAYPSAGLIYRFVPDANPNFPDLNVSGNMVSSSACAVITDSRYVVTNTGTVPARNIQLVIATNQQIVGPITQIKGSGTQLTPTVIAYDELAASDSIIVNIRAANFITTAGAVRNIRLSALFLERREQDTIDNSISRSLTSTVSGGVGSYVPTIALAIRNRDGSPGDFCDANAFRVLTVTNKLPNTSYVWSNGLTGDSIALPADSQDSYDVIAYDNATCQRGSSTPLSVTGTSLLPSYNPATYPIFCLGQEVSVSFIQAPGERLQLFNAGGNLTALSSSASTTTTQTFTFSPSPGVTGKIYLRKVRNGCTVEQALSSRGVAFISPTPARPTIAGGSVRVFCAGAGNVLSVSNPSSQVRYRWSDGSEGPSITVSTPGSYTVQAFDTAAPRNVCPSTSSNAVSIQDFGFPDNVSITPTSRLLLAPTRFVDLQATSENGWAIRWELDGQGLIGTGNQIRVTQPGLYRAYSVNPQGCLQAFNTVNVEADFVLFDMTYDFSTRTQNYTSLPVANTITPLTPVSGGVPIARVQIGFPFQLANRRVDSLILTPNGQFYANQVGEFFGDRMLSVDTTVSYLLPLGVDMLFDASSSIRTTLTGTAPNRIRTIELVNLRTGFAIDGRYTYQVRLYEQSNLIEYHYGPSTPSTIRANFGCQVGLHANRNGISRKLGIDGTWANPRKVVDYDAGQSNIGLAPNNTPAINRVFVFSPVDLRPIVIDQIDRISGRTGFPDTLLMTGFGLGQVTQVVVRDSVSFSPAQPSGSRQEFSADFLQVINNSTIKVVFANRSFVRGLSLYTANRLIPVDIPVCNLNYRPILSTEVNGRLICGTSAGQVVSLGDTIPRQAALYQWFRNGVFFARGGRALVNQPGTYTVKYGFSETDCMVDLANASFRYDTAKTTSVTRSICSNGTLTIGSQTLTQPGTYRIALTARSGCDSIINLQLNTRPTSLVTLDRAICQGQSFAFGSQNLTTAGRYTRTLTNALGCDSVITLNLTVNPLSATRVDASICRNQSYAFGSQNLTVAGIYTRTLANRFGCDSVVTLHLDVVERFFGNIQRSICQGDSTLFFGQWLKLAGNYSQNLTTAAGCDSTVTLALSIRNRTQAQVQATICEGQRFAFGNQSISQAGVYTRTLANAAGCDSVITLTLSVSQPSSVTINSQTCEGQPFRFGTQSITTAGTYTLTLANRLGCDSVVTLNLSLLPVARTQVQAAICEGENYRFGNRTLSLAGSYSQTLRAANGCDSIVSLTLQVRPLSRTVTHASICSGQSYAFAGNALTSSGQYADTLTNALGCDSIVVLNLNVIAPIVTRLQINICTGQTYAFGNAQLSQSGDYARTLTAVSGCDSTIALQLTVAPRDSQHIQETICANSSYRFGSSNLTTAGNYRLNLTNRLGCDSIITLSLSVLPTSESQVSAQICQGASYAFGSQNLTTGGTYTRILANALGCDSIITLILTVNPVSNTNIQAQICQGTSYTFGSQTLTTSGVYTQTLISSSGCDSVITLQLRVNPLNTTRITQVLCQGQSYLFGDISLTQAGTYNRILPSQSGCDSTIILTLIVNPVRVTTLTISICEGRSYAFGSQVLTAEGSYSRTISGSTGCDSIINLNLTILPVPTRRLTASICEGQSYNFGTQLLTNAGTYTRTVTHATGCDSLITLELTVLSQRLTQLQQAICEGSSYAFGSQLLTRTGVYIRTVPAASGCDSVIRLTLTVEATPPVPGVFVDNGSLQVSNDVSGDRYIWLDGRTNQPVRGLTGALINSFDSTGINCLRVIRIRNNCPSDTSALICRTAIKGLQNIALKLYPNPTQDQFTIEGQGLQSISVLNALGQVVLAQTASDNPSVALVSTENLPSGMYLVQVHTANGLAIERLTIKR